MGGGGWDCIRAGSAPARCGSAAAPSPGRPRSQVQGVPHAPGRVGRRHVEGLEVVPVGLDLRALGHDEAHPDEDVLELVARARHQVEVTPPRHLGVEDLGEIEPVRRQLHATGRLFQHDPPRGDDRLDLFPHALQPQTGLTALIRFEAAECLLLVGQGGPFAEQTRSRRRPIRRASRRRRPGTTPRSPGPHRSRARPHGLSDY